MFGNLKAGATLYILSKGENPCFMMGKLLQDPQMRQEMPQNQQQFMMNPLQVRQVVDISVKVGDDTKNFSGINPSLSVVNTGINGYIVSDDKAAFLNEVDAFGMEAQTELNRTAYNQKVVSVCEQTKLNLNPEARKAAERDSEIADMRKKMDAMYGTITELTSLLKGKQSNSQPRKEQ